MRCLTLAESLNNKGANVSFICRELPGNLINYIRKKGFSTIILPPPYEDSFHSDLKVNQSNLLEVSYKTDMRQTKSALAGKQQSVDWLIVDHYAIDAKWEEGVRPFVKKLMVIDDLANRFHNCDLLLDQNICESMDSRYDRLVPEHTLKLLGPKYMLIREEFVKSRKVIDKCNGIIHRILIFFGGADRTNETSKAIKAMKLLNREDIRCDVVVGSTNPNKYRVKRECEFFPNMHFHCQVDNMARLMLKADLAIGAGGSSAWERCYLGLPAITVETADNQAEILSLLAEKRVICHLGKSKDVREHEVVFYLRNLLSCPKEVQKMSTSCLDLMEDLEEDTVTRHIVGGGYGLC